MIAAASNLTDNFVELDVSFGAWLALGVAIAVMLAIDLFRHRDNHEPTQKEALLESAVWVACGLALRRFDPS